MQKWCSGLEHRLFVCPALETIKGWPLTLEECYALANHTKNARRQRKEDLPETILLAIRMEVMVTNNLQMDLDITNGARGIIVDIILSHDEPDLEEDSTIILKSLPGCVLAKPNRTSAAALPQLREGVIPTQPAPRKMEVHVRGKTRTVTRKQFPTTSACSFTEYQAQGRRPLA